MTKTKVKAKVLNRKITETNKEWLEEIPFGIARAELRQAYENLEWCIRMLKLEQNKHLNKGERVRWYRYDTNN